MKATIVDVTRIADTHLFTLLLRQARPDAELQRMRRKRELETLVAYRTPRAHGFRFDR